MEKGGVTCVEKEVFCLDVQLERARGNNEVLRRAGGMGLCSLDAVWPEP